MKSTRGRIRIQSIMLAVAAVFLASAAQAASPLWMPGFPLRAGTAVIIMWTPVPGASEYKLLKKTGEADFVEVYKGPVNTYNDADAPPTKTIEYKVIAVTGGKDGEPSPPAVLKGIEPLKPPVFTGSIPAADAVTLRWSNPPGTMFFNLYRADKKDGAYALLGSVQQDTYTDRKIEKGKTYYYKVAAIDKNNTESDKSQAIEAKLLEIVSVVEEKPVIRKPVPKGSFTGEDLYEFNQPLDIGLTQAGQLFVVERTSIQFVDKDGKYQRRINFPAEWSAAGCATPDRDGNLVLAFYADAVIRKIELETGKLIWERKYAPAPGKANNPNYVAIDKEGNYWIVDGARYQLIKMDGAGNTLDNVGRLQGQYNADSRNDTDLPTVTKAYYNPHDGNLYCLLAITAEVRVIDPRTGKGVKTFGGFGLKNGQFSGVGGVAFRKNGNILVLDSMRLLVKEFTKDFAYVATYADIVEKTTTKLSSGFANSLALKEDIGRFYVLGTLANKVVMYDLPAGE